MSSKPKLVSAEAASREPEQLTALFHMVNRLLPDDQVVLAVPPETPAKQALSLMKQHGYSQLPVVQGRAVLGLFSFRAFALEALAVTGNERGLGDLPVEEFLEHEAPRFARLTDEFRGLIDVLNVHDCVVVSGPHDLIALLTPMDVLRYLYKVADAFVLIEEIELSLRALVWHALPTIDDIQQAAHTALSEKYGAGPPARLEEFTFDDYVGLIRDGRVWARFAGVLGGTRDRARGKLELVRDIRNDVFHFKRKVTIEDHERLHACREWLLRCIRKVEARAEVTP